MQNRDGYGPEYFVACVTALVLVNMFVLLHGLHKEDERQRGVRLPWLVETAYQRSASVPGKIPYRFHAVDDPSGTKRFPLVVFLHGAGQRGRDNRRQLEGLPAQMIGGVWPARYPCHILAPQCPADQHWWQWMEELERIIEHTLETYSIDHSRVYVTGLSMGGYGTWELASRRPDLFAAAVPLCGGGQREWAGRLSAVPVYAVHGNQDRTVPVSQSRQMIDALRRAGAHPRYDELAGVGHDCWTETYSRADGVVAWMFRQRKERKADAEGDRAAIRSRDSRESPERNSPRQAATTSG